MVAICFWHATSRGASDGFAVEGELECGFYRSNGEVFTNQLLAFEMQVGGGGWRLVNNEGPSNKWVRGSDGAAVYHVFHDVGSTSSADPAIVEFGPMPLGGYPAAVPWLAFASAGQLARSEGIFAPWADPYSEPSVHAYELKVSSFDQDPHLPRSIDFVVNQNRVNAFRDGRYIGREGRGGAEGRIAIARAGSEPDGFLGGRYEVASVTNVNGFLIPVEFKLTKFRARPPGANQMNSPIAAVYHGVIRSVRAMSIVEVLPGTSAKPLSVIDLRFRDTQLPLDSIYYSTDRWITDTNDTHLLAIKTARVKSLPGHPKTELRRYVVLGATVVFAIVPLLWCLVKKLKQMKSLRE